MDERKEILQDTIDRLIETALQELDQKLPEAGGGCRVYKNRLCGVRNLQSSFPGFLPDKEKQVHGQAQGLDLSGGSGHGDGQCACVPVGEF